MAINGSHLSDRPSPETGNPVTGHNMFDLSSEHCTQRGKECREQHMGPTCSHHPEEYNLQVCGQHPVLGERLKIPMVFSADSCTTHKLDSANVAAYVRRVISGYLVGLGKMSLCL